MGGTRLSKYIHKYINCNIKIDNTNHPNGNTYFHCIGGGLGNNGTICIDSCEFNSVYTKPENISDVQYHGNWNETQVDGHSCIYIKNCYFAHTMSISSPNTESKKKYLMFTNNSISSDLHLNNTSEDYWEIRKWNNEIRTN